MYKLVLGICWEWLWTTCFDVHLYVVGSITRSLSFIKKHAGVCIYQPSAQFISQFLKIYFIMPNMTINVFNQQFKL